MDDVRLTPRRDGIEIGSLEVRFMRTIRIPDDGRQHPLPPSLGTFAVRRVSDYSDRVPAEWVRHGGVFMPLHEREAMWMSFDAPESTPYALKVAAGMVNAVTGRPWSEQLERKQDYVVVPEQPWLDGIKTETDSIRQFVAMPLGGGHTIEGQIAGEERHGGIQLLAYPAKPGAVAPPREAVHTMMATQSARMCASASVDMGLGAGGRMRQKIYRDPHGIQAWDQERGARVFIHLCNAAQWHQITGEPIPPLPREIAEYDGPWFDLPDEDTEAVQGSKILDAVETVDEVDSASGNVAPDVLIVDPPKSIGPVDRRRVHDGDW